jgi:hypothetical protein
MALNFIHVEDYLLTYKLHIYNLLSILWSNK